MIARYTVSAARRPREAFRIVKGGSDTPKAAPGKEAASERNDDMFGQAGPTNESAGTQPVF